MIVVRDYRPTDFATLIQMGKRFHEESVFEKFSYDVEALLQIHDLVLSHDDFACFVAEDIQPGREEGRIVGMFVGGVTPFFFSRERYGFDMCLFVDPDRRGTLAAAKLLAAATTWTRSRGARQLRYGVATGIAPERADKFFRGMGFEHGGALYTYDL